MSTTPTPNGQTPGPAFAKVHIAPQWAVKVGKRGGMRFLALTSQANDEANARLLAASYTMADRDARELGVDAVELCEALDLAALIRAAQGAVSLLECLGNGGTDTEAAVRALRRALPPVFPEPATEPQPTAKGRR